MRRLKFNPKATLSEFAKASIVAFAAASGVPPDSATLYGDVVKSVIEGTSFEEKESSPIEHLKAAVSTSIENAFLNNNLELTREFKNALVEKVFSPEASKALFATENPEIVFAERIKAAFEASEIYDTSTLPLDRIILDIVGNLDNAIERDSTLVGLVTLIKVENIEKIITARSNQYRLIQKIPPLREVFQGRDEKLDEIHSAFMDGYRAIYLEGMGGIGKSELAKRYAKKYESEYSTITFVSYSGSIKDVVCDSDSIEIVGLNRFINESADDFFKRKLQVLRSLVDSKSLIILDNYDVFQDPDITSFFEGSHQILITTRFSHSDNKTIKVDEIRDSDIALRIFEEYYKKYYKKYSDFPLDAEDKEPILKLLKTIEYHTYTIELLAKQMAASFKTGSEMLDAFTQHQLKDGLIETVQGRNNKLSAFDHIRVVFATSGLTEQEKQILKELSLIGIKGIYAQTYKEWSGIDSFNLVGDLIQKSWIRSEQGKKLSLHPLVIEVVHADLKPSEYDCGRFLDGIGMFSCGAWTRPVKNNLAVCDNISSVLDYFSPFCPRLWYDYEPMIGFLWQVAYFDESIKYMRILYNTVNQSYGSKNMITGHVAKGLASCYFNANHLDKSIEWYKLALKCMIDSEHYENSDIALAYEKVGRCYTWSFNYDLDKAEYYFNIALRIRKGIISCYLNNMDNTSVQKYQDNTLASAYAGLASTYLEIGRMYQSANEFKKALSFALRSKFFRLKYTKYDISSVAYSLYDEGICQYHIGIDYLNIGKDNLAIRYLNKAENNLSQALKINIKMRAEYAFDVAFNYEYLGDVYSALEKKKDAFAVYNSAKDMFGKLAGEESEDVIRITTKIQTL